MKSHDITLLERESKLHLYTCNKDKDTVAKLV